VEGNATVTVKDSTARIVRRWQSPVTRGVNTLTWDLQAERGGNAGAAGAAGSGLADAAPGAYTVEVAVGEARASGVLTVRPDPILARRPR